MGILSMISEKKRQFQGRIRERQQQTYTTNLQKLELARTERAELEKRVKVERELKEEKQAIRGMKYRKLSGAISTIKTKIKEQQKKAIASEGTNPFISMRSNMFDQPRQKKRGPFEFQ